MGLTGALSNRSDQAGFDRLDALRRRLLRQAAQTPRQGKRLRSRSGAVQQAILTASPQAMRAAVERLLNMRVPKGTVNSCLSVGARGADARFERMGHGRYRLRGAEAS